MSRRGSVRDYIPSVTEDTEPLIKGRTRISVRDIEEVDDEKLRDEDRTTDDGTTCSYLLFKGFILFCISLMGWSMFLAMDLQAGLENQFQAANGINMTHATFNNFMTFFSIPNIPGSILGGFFVNYITHRRGSPLFVLGMIVGQLLGAFGAIRRDTGLLFLGRAVFGLACELTNICTFAHIVHWFRGKAYNFAFAIVVAMARLGTVTIMIGGPEVVKKMDSIIDSYGSKVMDETMQITYIYLATTAILLIGLASAFFLLYVTPKPEPESNADDENKGLVDSDDLTIGGKIKSAIESFRKQAKLPTPCWLVIFICMIFYAAVEPWVIGAKTSFEKFHGVTDTTFSAVLSALISIVPIPLGPILGLMVDAVNCNAWWCLTGALLSVFGHLSLMTHYFAGVGAIAPAWLLLLANVLIGVGYSMVAGSIWSLLSYTVPKKQTSIAYGMIQAFQHIGIIFATMVSGLLVDSAMDVRTGYFHSEMFFMIILMVSLFLCVFFIILYGSGSKSMYDEDSSGAKGPH